MKEKIKIPYDIYKSPNEMVIIMPLWWVNKDSLEISIDDYRLVIRGVREKMKLKDDCIPLREDCYWWEIEQTLDLPPQTYFDQIHSKLSIDNVLQIIVPKSLVPEKIKLEVERA